MTWARARCLARVTAPSRLSLPSIQVSRATCRIKTWSSAPGHRPTSPAMVAPKPTVRAVEASRQSYEREQRAQPAYAQPTYAPPPKAEQVPPTYSSSFFSAPPPMPPPPPAPPVHSGGSSTAEFEARVVAAGLARILPDLKKEEICDLDTLCSLQEDDLKELGLAVGARVKLMRLIRSVQAEG